MWRWLVLCASVCTLTARAGEPIVAVGRQRVHPVLIGRANVELAELVIDVAPPDDVTLEELAISLAGTSDVADLTEVRVFAGQKPASFSTEVAFGQPTHPAEQIQISGSQRLRPGRNVFWLAGTLRDTAPLDHRVRAEFVEVRTTRGAIRPTNEEPARSLRIGVALRQAGQDGVHTSRIPVLGSTPRGTLLCVYDLRRRSQRDLQGDIDVGLSRSTDGGQTWEPFRVIMDQGAFGGLPQDQNGVGDPGMVIDQQTGTVFVFALWVHGKPGKHQWRGDGSEPGFEIGKTAQFLLVRSDDDGRTWSAAENLTRVLKSEEWILFAPSPQQGIQLADGTLVMPVQGRDADGPFAALMLSADHGNTWQVAPRAYSGGNECQVAELGDGTLMLNIRNGDRHRRAVVVSGDRGQTWSLHATHEQALVEPACNGSLYRWVHRRDPGVPPLLLFANPRDEKARVRHTILVSRDDGQTWPERDRLLLDEGRGFGYPSLSRVDDEHLGIVYEGSQAHLVFERISRGELARPAE